MLEVQAGGARLQLLPQCAAYLPGSDMLLVADAHIGKAQSFRRLGVPVPGGTTQGTLQRLSDAVAATGARHIVFLGDLLHAARGRSTDTLARVAAWRVLHADLQLTLVRGNHDRSAGDPPADWRVLCVPEPLRLAGLALCLGHHPEPDPQGDYMLAGHVHPGAIVHGGAHERLRLPCFHFGPAVGVLPAFGEFTGMHVLPRGPQDRIYVSTGDAVRALPNLHCPA
ncbi:MAG: ligase-associated DNA damage response endonuclease PdeM [Rubrivivax sp.]|nr:ligase-associated DNA damage response endonuclease PdeM [Rubrivivax sp.]